MRAKTFSLHSALITGATSGIGQAFAERLAADGARLFLTGRNQDKLEELKSSLGQKVQVETLTADLATPEGLAAVESWAKSIPNLDLLVNNAGFGQQGAFLETPAETHAAMLRVHGEVIWRLCYAVLPSMRERRGGAIINVASIAAFLPLVADPLYCATKSYQYNLSVALHEEVQEFGVRVQALCPGLTHTNFHSRGGYEGAERSPQFLWSTPKAVVQASLRDLERNKPVCIPNRWNHLLIFISRRPRLVRFIRARRERSKSKG